MYRLRFKVDSHRLSGPRGKKVDGGSYLISDIESGPSDPCTSGSSKHPSSEV